MYHRLVTKSKLDIRQSISVLLINMQIIWLETRKNYFHNARSVLLMCNQPPWDPIGKRGLWTCFQITRHQFFVPPTFTLPLARWIAVFVEAKIYACMLDITDNASNFKIWFCFWIDGKGQNLCMLRCHTRSQTITHQKISGPSIENACC